MTLTLGEHLALPIEAATQTFLVVGKRGSGKTTTCVRLAEQLFKAGVPFVVVDPVDTWYGLKSSRDGASPGLAVYVFGGKHADLPLEPTAGALIADALIEHNFSAVLSVKHFSGRERGRFVADFAQRLFQKNTSARHLILEEAHEVAPQNPYKGEEEMLGHVTRIWKLGRSSGLGGSAVTQRPASLSKNITTQAEILIVHRLLGPQDVAAVREWIRYHGEREDILAQLSTLKTGEAFIWAPDFPEGHPIGLKRVTMLNRETFDSSATPKAGHKAAEPKALAPIDLDRLSKQMAATIERAKAEDPRELRRRILELERALKTKNTPTPPPVKTERIEVPVIREQDLKAVADVVRTVTAEGTRIRADIEATFNAGVERVVQAMQPVLVALGQAHVVVRHSAANPKSPDQRSLPPRREPRRPLVRAVDGTGPTLGRGGDARMLTALAQHDEGLTPSQLSILSGIARRGGTFRTYLGKLRQAGWVSTNGNGRLYVTAPGLEILGDYEPLPTGPALIDWWRRELGESGLRAIFDVCVHAYPQALSLDTVAERAGIAREGGTFRTYVGKLRTLELLEGRGELRASEALFES